MVCGLEIFESFIPITHVDFLLEQFGFGGFFDLKNGIEIPIPSRKTNCDGYERMIWRKAIHRHIEIRIGVKYDKLTGKDFYHLKVIGSVHKYACNGDNSGLFTAIDAIVAINELCNELQIDKNRAKITSIEIGVNLKLWFPAFEYFRRNLLRYKFVFFEEMKSEDRQIIGWVAGLTHYLVKVYSKGDNTIRVEVRYGDTQKLKKDYGLSFVSDLTSDVIVKMAENEVLSKWKDVVGKGGLGTVKGYYPANIKQKELQILKDFASKSYLEEIKMRIQDAISKSNLTEKNRLTRIRDRGKDKYDLLVNKYSEDNNLQIIYEMIQQRINDEKEKCVFFDIGIKVKKYTECKKSVLIKITNTNNNNKQVKTILPMKQEQVSTPVINLSKKEKEVTKRKQSEQLTFNFMKALNATMKCINDNTVAVKKLTDYLQTKAA